MRTARAVRIVIGHTRIPRPIRWLAALALLPIPGPFDEAVLLVVASILFVFYRRELRQAWRDADANSSSPLAHGTDSASGKWGAAQTVRRRANRSA